MTAPDELERAVDRLEKAMKIADQYAAGVWFGEGNDGFVSFATILAILSERADLLATVERMRGALEPFEALAEEFSVCGDGQPISIKAASGKSDLNVGHLRRVADAAK